MAHAEKLANDILEVVAEQIGAMVTGVVDAKRLAGARVTIDKTPFEIWVLGADALLKSTYELRQLASPTGQWHHQVALNDVAKAFARSAPLGAEPGSWRVLEFFESKLAEKIAKAARWIDDENNVTGDPLVRLLDVPAYQVYVFWLLWDDQQDRVLLIDCPEGCTHLLPDRLLSQSEFINALRREQHTVGRTLS